MKGLEQVDDFASGGTDENGPVEASAWPCPCHRSYFSHSCCDAEDGMMWEHAKPKLGEL